MRDHTPLTWVVRLAADGDVLGTVEACCREEALGRGIRLAATTGRRPQRLRV